MKEIDVFFVRKQRDHEQRESDKVKFITALRFDDERDYSRDSIDIPTIFELIKT